MQLGGLGANIGSDSWNRATIKKQLARQYVEGLKAKEMYGNGSEKDRSVAGSKCMSPYESSESRTASPYQSQMNSARYRALEYAHRLKQINESKASEDEKSIQSSPIVKELKAKHDFFQQ